ncbi:CorA family divalent cation transporter [Tunturiibacter gelidoferens]|nr:CorA family divalent cation transporter [Edaphobacter lichenicola]
MFQTTELDIFFSQRYLVTFYEQPMSSVQEMFKRVEVNPEVKQWEIDILLYELLDRLMDQYAPILDDFQESLDKLEELAIDNPPPEFLVTISDRKTELLNLRRIMTQQREISRETDAGRGAVHGPVVTDLFPGRS